jgi:hypothetical protein
MGNMNDDLEMTSMMMCSNIHNPRTSKRVSVICEAKVEHEKSRKAKLEKSIMLSKTHDFLPPL